MRAFRAVLIVAAALVAVVHADEVSDNSASSVLGGNAASVANTTDTSTATATPSLTPTEEDTASLATSSNEETLTETTETQTPETETPVTTTPAADVDAEAPAAVVPADTDSSSSEASGSEASSLQASRSTSGSASSSGHVDALTDESSTISNTAQAALSTSGFVGVAFGALACVGAVVLIVTYKKKGGRDSEGGQQRPPSSCAYLEGNGFTPDSRSLDAILDVDNKPQANGRQAPPNDRMVPVLSMADLSSSAAARASSPFGTNSRSVRVSSPVRPFSSNASDDMVFATSSRRQHDGSDLVLTFAEMDRTSSASTVAAIEDGRGQVLL